MRWFFRLFRYAFLLALLAAVIGGGVIYFLANQSIPPHTGQLTAKGLRDDLRILRDARAVPHIFGKSDHDVMFGLGYVHAQDRLWQMTLRRLAFKGQLATVFGARKISDTATMVDVDRLFRVLDLDGAAERSLAHMSAETRADLDAYAAGVNAWLAEIGTGARGRGAPEMFLLSQGVAPWTPADSIAMLKSVAAQLSGDGFVEAKQAKFMLNIGPEKMRDLFPDAPGAQPMALPNFAALMGQVEFAALKGDSTPQFLLPSDPSLMGASNAWAVSGKRSASGAPLLAADPHLPLSAPGIWYMARLQLQSGGVIGGTIPGIPAVLVGRNEAVGWGLTTLYADTVDLYVERLAPGQNDHIIHGDKTLPIAEEVAVIHVKGGEPVRARLQRTLHGPVLPLELFGLKAITPEGHLLSMAWTGLSPADTTYEGLARLMRLKDSAGLEAIAPLVIAPTQNIVIADKRNIGIRSLGAVPLRLPSHQTQGRVPAPGWNPQNDWQGVMPIEMMPRAFNPESGAVANANNRITDAAFPNHIGHHWPEPYRFDRLSKLLNGRAIHSANGFQLIQTDAVSEMARKVLPLVAAKLWWKQGQIAADPVAQRREAALNLLAEWNGDMNEHLAEPLIFNAWMRELTKRLSADELGIVLSRDYRAAAPLFVERVFRNIDGAAKWCDIVQTRESEDCDEISLLALDAALAELAATYGENVKSWRWGTAHLAVHGHMPGGLSPWMSWLFNIEHPTSGDDHTLLRGGLKGRGDEPFRNVHAAGLRVVYDFADLDRSTYVSAIGQSGHFLSRHYDDTAEAWRTGQYFPLSLAESDARNGAVGELMLSPAR